MLAESLLQQSRFEESLYYWQQLPADRELDSQVRDVIQCLQTNLPATETTTGDNPSDRWEPEIEDDSTLDRFSKKGCNIWRINSEQDLSLIKHAGVESIQAALNEINAKKISERYGKADLLIVRHIWEHVYDQRKFVYLSNTYNHTSRNK